MSIKWNKSEDGYVTSKCGRFDIEPKFIGRTTPQGYDLYFRAPGDPRVRVNRLVTTQREAKDEAERHVAKVIETFFRHVKEEENAAKS